MQGKWSRKSCVAKLLAYRLIGGPFTFLSAAFLCHHAKLKASTATLVAQCSSYVPAMTLWNLRTLPAIKSRLSLLLG